MSTEMATDPRPELDFETSPPMAAALVYYKALFFKGSFQCPHLDCIREGSPFRRTCAVARLERVSH